MWILLHLLLMSAIPAGAYLLWRGLKGRQIDNHPHCTQCGYDLFGLPPTVRKICPECGSSLTTYTGIRRGQRRRAGRLIALAVLLIVAGGLGLRQIDRIIRQRTERAAAFLEAVRAADVTTATSILKSHPAVIAQSATLDPYFDRQLVEAAAIHNNPGIAALLVGAGVNVNQPIGSPVESWLHAAARAREPAIAQALLDHGADPNARDADGRTPLHHASSDVEMTALLLFNGADPNLPDRHGAPPLSYAASSAAGPVMTRLLRNGADPSAVQPEMWELVVFKMLGRGQQDGLSELLQLAPDALKGTRQARPLLHVAVEARRLDVAAFLLDRGAASDVAGDQGRTALHIAAEALNAPAVDLLLAHDADPNRADDRGTTPLHLAASGEDPAIVRMLIRAGGGVHRRDHEGHTPHSIAAHANRTGMLELIDELDAR